MKLVYAIRDVKENAFGLQLMLFPTDASASRAFGNTVNSQDSNPYKDYPADFELYHIGAYDDEFGTIQAEVPPRFVVRGDTLVNS